jgi:CHASE3 domain sensor protein
MEEIRPLIEKLNQVNISALKREGRDFDFADIHPLIVEIFENIKALENHPEFWNYLPQNRRDNIKSHLKDFSQYIDQIQNFNPNQGNPQFVRDDIARNIRNNYDQLFEYLFPQLKLHILEKEFSVQKIQDIVKQSQSAVEEIQQQKQQGEEILKAMREASAVAGVSNFAGVFGEQAQKHQKSAILWLIASIFAAIAIGVFLWWIFDQLVETIKGGVEFTVSLQIFLAKILLLSFFSVVFYQIVKNYNANMHLYTLNKHRENSLKTFQAFVESTNDPKTKDAVLIQATKAIFEAGDTGYVSSKDSTITGMETIKIVDQLKEK